MPSGVIHLRATGPVRGNGRNTGEFQRRVNAVFQPFLQRRLHVVAVRAAVPEKFDDFARLDVGDSDRQYVVIGAFAVFHRLCLGDGSKGGGKGEDGQGFFQHIKLRVGTKRGAHYNGSRLGGSGLSER